MAFLIPFNETYVLDTIDRAFVQPALERLPNARMKRSGIASVKLVGEADEHDLTVVVYRVTCKPAGGA
jgi:hypothetical protein